MLVKAKKETRAFKDHLAPASSLQQARSKKYNNHWCHLHRKLKPGRCKFDDDDADDGGDGDDGDDDNNVDIDDDDDGRWSEWVTVALF